jgi:hypothetical protein
MRYTQQGHINCNKSAESHRLPGLDNERRVELSVQLPSRRCAAAFKNHFSHNLIERRVPD